MFNIGKIYRLLFDIFTMYTVNGFPKLVPAKLIKMEMMFNLVEINRNIKSGETEKHTSLSNSIGYNIIGQN